MSVSNVIHPRRMPAPAALLELIKPITWFPPVWAYLCGVVSIGVSPLSAWPLVLLGMVLAGPVVCGMSQAANDWCDRHVDAINEPDRPIPSGRVPASWALGLALVMSGAALLLGWMLGPWGFGATALAVVAAWAYSAPPIRLKRSGWWGPSLVALCYEGLPWVTGAAVLAAGAPPFPVLALALLYAMGAQGIMLLNDFKAMAGDRATGIKSMPVLKGPDIAARIACSVMIVPQLVVTVMLLVWGRPWHALVVAALIATQIVAMRRLLRDPVAQATWYSGMGVPLYVAGMMAAALAVRSVEIGP
ncbi:chlorophyll synthase [Tranquillimonas rosea]|uniref:Chlorophyll synthase n=1 Tax=Tranquillimonas rosea TaxID=641238 RepID=A0A1H9SIM9_9RHOB|nr:chlorophyll synthase ChlG [Tranquillimonas rosea]SER84807.1 chlorophyll synthase [Tranquillimonas rosea]